MSLLGQQEKIEQKFPSVFYDMLYMYPLSLRLLNVQIYCNNFLQLQWICSTAKHQYFSQVLVI